MLCCQHASCVFVCYLHEHGRPDEAALVQQHHLFPAIQLQLNLEARLPAYCSIAHQECERDMRTFAKLPCPSRIGSPLPSNSSVRSTESEGTVPETRMFMLHAPLKALCLIWRSRRQISSPTAIMPSMIVTPRATPAIHKHPRPCLPESMLLEPELYLVMIKAGLVQKLDTPAVHITIQLPAGMSGLVNKECGEAYLLLCACPRAHQLCSSDLRIPQRLVLQVQ